MKDFNGLCIYLKWSHKIIFRR